MPIIETVIYLYINLYTFFTKSTTHTKLLLEFCITQNKHKIKIKMTQTDMYFSS